MGYGAIAIAGLVIAAGASAYSIQNSRSQSRRQRAAQRIQERRRALQQIGEARRARAQVISAATAAGASGSSAQVGGAGSITSQVSGNLSFLDELSNINAQIARGRARAGIAGAVGQFGSFLSGQASQAQRITATARASGVNENDINTGTIFDFFG